MSDVHKAQRPSILLSFLDQELLSDLGNKGSASAHSTSGRDKETPAEGRDAESGILELDLVVHACNLSS